MKFLKNNISTLLIINTASGFNYLFQVAIARNLSVEDFGIFNSLNSLVVILSAPLSIISIIFSRSSAKLSIKSISSVKTLIISGLKFMVIASTAAFFSGILAMPLIKQYLHISLNLPIIFMIIQWSLSFLVPVIMGVLQGLKRFEAFGLGSGSYSVTRLLTGFLFVMVLGWGINGAILAEVLGSIAIITLGYWFLRDVMSTTQEHLGENLWKDMRSFIFPTAVFTSISLLLVNADIIMVRHYCPNEAGLYAIASILGKICLFLPGAFNYVLFPEAVLANESEKEGSRFLWITLGLTSLFAGGAAFMFCMFPSQVIALFFGIKYQDAAPILQYISISMALMAMTNVIATNSLAHSEFSFLWPLGGGVIMCLTLIFLFHDSSLQIAELLFLSTVFISVGVFLVYFLFKNRKPKKNIRLPI